MSDSQDVQEKTLIALEKLLTKMDDLSNNYTNNQKEMFNLVSRNMEKDMRTVARDSTAKESTEDKSSDKEKLALELKYDTMKALDNSRKGDSIVGNDYIRQQKTLRSLLPKFDPTIQDSANGYIQKLSYYHAKAQMDEKVFMEIMGSTLERQAGTWFINKDFKDYVKFAKEFEMEFCSFVQTRQFRLFLVHIEKNEELRDFARRVKQLCLEADITSEQQIIGYFINELPMRLKYNMSQHQQFDNLAGCVSFFLGVSNILGVVQNQKGNYYKNNQDGNNQQNTNEQQNYYKLGYQGKNYNPNYRKQGYQQKDNQQNNQQNQPRHQNQNYVAQEGTSEPIVSFAPSVNLVVNHEGGEDEPTVSFQGASQWANQQSNVERIINGVQNTALYEEETLEEQMEKIQQQVLALKRQKQELQGEHKQQEKGNIRVPTTNIKDFDFFTQLADSKSNLTLLDLMFLKPYKTKVMKALQKNKDLDSFKLDHSRDIQFKALLNLKREQQEQTEWNSKMQPVSQQNPPNQIEPMQQGFIAPELLSTYDYTYPIWSAYRKSTKTIAKVYKAYVETNSTVPSQQGPRVKAARDQGKKYMTLIKLNDKVAIGQLDSGSHYTIISYDMVLKYGLQGLMQPSKHKYLVANGAIYSFLGEIPKVSLKFGNVTLNVNLQVTIAQTYTILLGQDLMDLLYIDLLTSQRKVGYYDQNKQAHFLPYYGSFDEVPKEFQEYLKSFQGVPKALEKAPKE